MSAHYMQVVYILIILYSILVILVLYTGSWLVPFSVFCVTNTVFGALDIFGLPSFLQKYKIQRDKNVPVSQLHH